MVRMRRHAAGWSHAPAAVTPPCRARLAATVLDEAKHLPDQAIELPMLAVSRALQFSLRAQQRYAALAARGDELLAGRRITDEPPPWATFDEPVAIRTTPPSRMRTTRPTASGHRRTSATEQHTDGPAARARASAKGPARRSERPAPATVGLRHRADDD